MKFKLPFLFLLTLFFAQASQAQNCLPDGITITTQTEVDNFAANYPGCTTIGGALYINSYQANDPVTNLDGLSQITSVGILNFTSCHHLTSITGLSNLQEINSHFIVLSCPLIQNFSGLNNVTVINGKVRIEENTQLSSLTGLNGIQSITGDLYIEANPNLTSISDLSALTQISGNYLTIASNSNLTSLTGLQGLTVSPSLSVRNNNQLTSLSGLDNVISLNGFCHISGNPALSSLSGLDNVHSVTSLTILGNPTLTSINSLANLTSCGWGFNIVSNAMLSSLNGLQNITSYYTNGGHPPEIDIRNNNNLSDLTGFPSLNNNPCSILIRENQNLSSLSGLNSLQQVHSLLVFDNPNLSSIADLQNLTQATFGLAISSSNVITSLNGLNNLTKVGLLSISNNAALTSIADLHNVSQCSGLVIDNNDKLTSLDGLNQITTTGKIMILGNMLLNNISALSGITHTTGHIHIINNATLTNLNGFENILSMDGFIKIQDNAILSDIAGLANIDATTISHPLTITNNPMLSNCNILMLCDYFAIPSNTYSLGNNKPGCNWPSELGCQPTNCPGTLAGYTKLGEFENHGYYLSNDPTNWQNAQASIANTDFYLASITSQVENLQIANWLYNPFTYSYDTYAFIGLNDVQSEGNLVWDNGETVDFTNFTTPAACPWCGLNSPENDFTYTMGNAWGVDNQWVQRKYIIETGCQTSDNGSITLSCPPNVEVSTTTNTAPASWNVPTTSTTCPTSSNVTLTQTAGIPSGSNFTVGTHTITFQATDDCNNSESCSFNVTVTTTTGGGSCEPIAGFTKLGEFNGHGYYLSDVSKPWSEAKTLAENAGGYLATMNDQAENDFLKSNLNNQMVFIGYNDADNEGSGAWANGEAVSLDLSYSNSSENDYAVMNFWAGTWQMVNQWVYKPFILEIDCGGSSTSANLEITDISCPVVYPTQAPFTVSITVTNSGGTTSNPTAFDFGQKWYQLNSTNFTNIGNYAIPAIQPNQSIVLTETFDISGAQLPGFLTYPNRINYDNFYVRRFDDNFFPPFVDLVQLDFYCKKFNSDLSIEITSDNYTYDETGAFQYAINVTNNGTEMAANVIASIGSAYFGRDHLEYMPADVIIITLNDHEDKLWHIPTLAAGETKTLNISFTTQQAQPSIDIVANVTSGHNLNTQGGNNTMTKTFSLTPTGNQPDLTISNITNLPTSGTPNTQVDFNFDLNNIGNTTATGSYVIGMYLSVDEAFSADDELVGEVPTGGTPVGTIADVPGAIAIPGNLFDGNYFLVLVVDNGNTIVESNENNNVISTPFAISSGTSGGCDANIAGFTKLGEFNGHGYYLSDASENWNQAKTLAENTGGYLATMNDQAENDFLKSNLNNNMVFIGFNDAVTDGTGAWVNGEAVTLDLSYDNSPEQDYAVMNFWAGTWQMVNQFVAKKFILEMNCNGNVPQPAPQISLKKKLALVSIYPNPAQDYLTTRILANSDEAVQFTIFNATGQTKVVSSKQLLIGSNEIGFEIQDLEPGIYYLNATGKNIHQTIRFIKID